MKKSNEKKIIIDSICIIPFSCGHNRNKLEKRFSLSITYSIIDDSFSYVIRFIVYILILNLLKNCRIEKGVDTYWPKLDKMLGLMKMIYY